MANVKPGDLAVVVKASLSENIGKVCVVLRAGSEPGWWAVEFPRPIRWSRGPDSAKGNALDECLRPLRNGEGQDQMLRIAGKPQAADDLAVRITTLREQFEEACREAVGS